MPERLEVDATVRLLDTSVSLRERDRSRVDLRGEQERGDSQSDRPCREHLGSVVRNDLG